MQTFIKGACNLISGFSRKSRPIPATALCALLGLGASAAHADNLGKIWLVGDSITSGFTIAGAYRPRLYTDLTNAGDSFLFVGSATNDSTTLLNNAGQNHQDGHSGYAIATALNTNGTTRQGIYNNINSYYNTVSSTQGVPNTILLMIGTNDINSNIDPTNAPARLDLLVSRIMSLDPTAHLFVASITPAKQGNTYMDAGMTNLAASIQTYNAAIPGIVAEHDALGQNVSFVDMYSALTLSDLGSDGLHPNATGYAKIGDTWASAVLAAAVPEPSSYALMLLGGVPLLCFVSRRRGAKLS